MKNKSSKGSAQIVKTSQSDQRASLRSCPSSVKGHKNPTVSPIGGKAMQGIKGK